MSFNAAALKLMADKGLSAHDIAEIAAVNEMRSSAAERQARYRERKRNERDVTRDVTPSPNERDILTPTREKNPSNKLEGQKVSPWSLPVGVSLQVWSDLMTNRKRKRLPNTETAWIKFNRDVEEVSAQTGIPPPKLIEMCTAKGWGAIYDPRDQRNERPDSNPTATALATVQAALRSGFG